MFFSEENSESTLAMDHVRCPEIKGASTCRALFVAFVHDLPGTRLKLPDLNFCSEVFFSCFSAKNLRNHISYGSCGMAR